MSAVPGVHKGRYFFRRLAFVPILNNALWNLRKLAVRYRPEIADKPAAFAHRDQKRNRGRRVIWICRNEPLELRNSRLGWKVTPRLQGEQLLPVQEIFIKQLSDMRLRYVAALPS